MADRMGVTSLYTFQNSTSNKKNKGVIRKLISGFSSRGPQMRIIDAALSEWETAHEQNDVYPKIKALMHIMIACRWWLKLKIGKSSSTTESRKRCIERLFTEAQSALKIVDKAGSYYANKRSNAIDNDRVVGAKTGKTKLDFTNTRGVSLHGSYGLEREFFVSNDKRFAVSAGAMKDLLASKPFETLTLDDFYNGFNSLQQYKRQESLVDYFSRNDRLDYLVMVQGNNFLNRKNEKYKTLDRVVGRNEPLRDSDMYAMDKYGNLFVSTIDGRDLGHTHYHNHSSFLSGVDVICAGMIVIHEGELAFISNSSGHYQPDRYALQNALGVLAEEVDITYVRVDVLVPNGVNQKYKATTFLQNPDAQPDWPDNWNDRYGLTVKM